MIDEKKITEAVVPEPHKPLNQTVPSTMRK